MNVDCNPLKVVLLTGSHPRHLFLAHTLSVTGLLSALVIEEREAFVPSPPANVIELDRINFVRHFRERDETERRFFAGVDASSSVGYIPTLRIGPADLNSEHVKSWVLSFSPDQVLTYGVHKLNDDLLQAFPKNSWNIHGGLSPWYRGVTTLFWPFYMLRPNWAGMTIHRLSSQLDAGAVIHHSVPELRLGDGVHDVAARAVLKVADDLVAILGLRKHGQEFPGSPQKATGKIFASSDWAPAHLRIIYDTFNNDIVDCFLRGELESPPPPLVSAF